MKIRSVYQEQTDSEPPGKDDLVNRILLTEHDWLSFKDDFEKLHPGFFGRLKTFAPGVTPAEARLTALMRLNLGNKEMAVMQGISDGAVRVTKSRLRARLHLSERDDLEGFIQNL